MAHIYIGIGSNIDPEENLVMSITFNVNKTGIKEKGLPKKIFNGTMMMDDTLIDKTSTIDDIEDALGEQTFFNDPKGLRTELETSTMIIHKNRMSKFSGEGEVWLLEFQF
ncbi:MAG: hypothetical protein IH946_11550 [Bacteroidetes bacterium]|nr:hypothetical protein [Bacteroidota bacterium]